jgi:hypothetical protein
MKQQISYKHFNLSTEAAVHGLVCCLSGASGELTPDMTTFFLLQLSASGLPVLLPSAKAKLKSLSVLPFHTHGGFKHWISRGHNKVMTLLRYTGTIFIVAICSV